MKGELKFFAACLLISVLLSGCKGYEHETIPSVKVNITIYPDNVNYLSLNHIGGYVYLTGGVAGIIVYRLDQTTFMAYDRACSYDWEDTDAWICVADDGLTLVDENCGSRFNILDGSVINGPAQYPLYFYKTTYDGRRLRIYN